MILRQVKGDSSMGHADQIIPSSEHFEIQKLAQGIYAAIAREFGAAFSNSGIIDLGDLTLVFDTFETPKAAEDLQAAAESLTGRPPTYVINSHHHADHWFGNQVFSGHATIISTHKTRDLMPVCLEELKSLKQNPSELNASLQENLQLLKAEKDPKKRSAIEGYVARLKHSLESLPTLELKLPNQTFESKVVFYGSQRSADLLALGNGHTSGDCFLALPEEKIAFLGDLAFFKRQPYLEDCDFTAWKNILEEIRQSKLETFIPGHGPVGKKTDLLLLLQYLNALEDLVVQVKQAGGSPEDALDIPLPEPFVEWQHTGQHRFEDNVRFLFQSVL
jgi:glyoxylase-like metal-dependent hydrolase (beta-lactamase superfamily II)